MMMLTLLTSTIVIFGSFDQPERSAETRSLPKRKHVPPLREAPANGAEAAPPAVRQRMFLGIGVGFEKTGTLQGVPLTIVLPDSPAARAGLVSGCIIAEINGDSTVGRTGDGCAQLIRDALGAVTVRYLDPALKPRTVTIDKEWIVVPE
ncbi:MAG TPA: PDZ domain-containing protein [Chthoniobacteraceae bacterium]|jgi:hypothetical protein|nr:PDZ domain-containing protein [Chthoniobacteraceae bacterium]